MLESFDYDTLLVKSIVSECKYEDLRLKIVSINTKFGLLPPANKPNDYQTSLLVPTTNQFQAVRRF